MKRIDSHCHVFNILSVGWKAILEQLYEISELISDAKHLKSNNLAIETVKTQFLLFKMKRFAELIAIFTDNGEEILSMLDNHYHQEFVLSPLMFDGDFILEIGRAHV